MIVINSLIRSNLCFSSATFNVKLLTRVDQALYCQLFRSEQVMRWIGEPLAEEQVKASFAAALRHNSGTSDELMHGRRLFLVIAEQPAEIAVGLMAVTFHIIAGDKAANLSTFNAEIGIMLLPSAQRKGLAQLVFTGLCHSLQQRSAVRYIVCNIADGNLAAKKLVSGLGFVYCKQDNCYKLQNNNLFRLQECQHEQRISTAAKLRRGRCVTLSSRYSTSKGCKPAKSRSCDSTSDLSTRRY